MFTVNFYNTTDQPNKLNKTLESVGSCNCQVNSQDGISIIDPIITVADNYEYINCNYVFIKEWGKYYFVKTATCKNSGITEYTLHEDVLMSHNAEITASTVMLSRSSNFFNSDLPDNRMPVTDKIINTDYVFEETPFTNNASFALVTIAGPN